MLKTIINKVIVYTSFKLMTANRLKIVFAVFFLLLFSCTTAIQATSFRTEGNLDLRLGAQMVNLDEWKLTANDSTGNISYEKVTDSGFYQTTAFNGEFRLLSDLKKNMVLDFTSNWVGQLFEPQVIKSRRYDTVYGNTELELGYSPSSSTLWIGKLFHRLDEEELSPYLSATTFGGEIELDKSLGVHTFLNFKGGLGDTSFANTSSQWNSNSESRWDHKEGYFKMVYTNIGPERTAVDGLPFHPDRYTPEPELFYKSSEILNLWESRSLIGRDGQARRILDNIPNAPSPPTQDIKTQIDIPGSTFAAGVGITNRDYENLNNQSFIRIDGSAFIKWELANRLTLTLDENIYWQDYNFEDDNLLLFDHFKNDLNLYLNHSTMKQYLSLGASVKHLFFDEATQWDLATTKLYGSWDYRQNRKYSYTARASYQRDIPDSPRPYNEYTKELFLFGAFRLHFDRKSLIRLSWEKEKEIVTESQSEFDSSFDNHKYGIRYEKDINSKLSWQTGYSFERERHELFYKNNRDEEIGFINLCVHL